MANQKFRDACDIWLRRQLGDRKERQQSELLVRFCASIGKDLSAKEAASMLDERLHALEAGLVVVRTSTDARDPVWRKPN